MDDCIKGIGDTSRKKASGPPGGHCGPPVRQRASDAGLLGGCSTSLLDDAGDRLTQSHPAPRSCVSALDHAGALGRSYGGFTRAVFGSPSYPSPLDRIRTGRRDRAHQLGLPPAPRHDSYEANQSFPKARPRAAGDVDVTPDLKTGGATKANKGCDLDGRVVKDNKGDGLNDVSFSAGAVRGSFSPQPPVDASLTDSWSYYNYMGGRQSTLTLPTTVRNPNKAIVTIDARSSQILVANEMASELFGFSQEELIGLELHDLVTLRSRSQEAIPESHLEESGEIIEVSGKVVDAVDSSGLVIPVSLWIHRLDTESPRCLVVMEPVERTTARVTFDSKGTILDCDRCLATLHGYSNAGDLLGMSLDTLIPALRLPAYGQDIDKSLKKQRATGRTVDGATFPLSVYIRRAAEPLGTPGCRSYQDSVLDESVSELFEAVVWVFSNISGMITVLPDGTICSINNNFSLMLFGYAQEELVGQNISKIIPNFRDDLDLVDTQDMPLPPLDDSDFHSPCKRKRSLRPAGPDDVFLELSQGSADTSLDVSLSRYMDDVNLSANHHAALAPPPGSLVDSPERSRNHSVSTDAALASPSCRLRILTDDDDKVTKQQSVSPDRDSDLLQDPSADLSTLSSSTDDLLDASDIVIHEVYHTNSKVDELVRTMSALTTESLCATPAAQTDAQTGTAVSLQEAAQTAASLQGAAPELSSDHQRAAAALETTQHIVNDIQRCTDQLRRSLGECLQGYHGDHGGQESNDHGSQDSGGEEDSDCVILGSESGRDSDVLDVCESSLDEHSGEKTPQKPPRLCRSSDHKHGRHGVSPLPSAGDGVRPLPFPAISGAVKRVPDLSPSLSASKTSTPRHPAGLQRQESLRKMLTQQKRASFREDRPLSREDRGSATHRSASRASYLRAASNQSAGIREGSCVGRCRHKDGTELGIVYQVKRVPLSAGPAYCLWVSRDPEDPGEGGRSHANLTLASSLNSSTATSLNSSMATSLLDSQLPDVSALSLGQQLVQKARAARPHEGVAGPPTVSRSASCSPSPRPASGRDSGAAGDTSIDCLAGSSTDYTQRYHTVLSIGKGAFGFVKLARRRDDDQEVVVKFIHKSKLSPDALVEDERLGRVPQEVSLLAGLSHPNIVAVLECFEGRDFYHMVMEKHGSGMDLFEFIDRSPNLDEPLASHMFRQLVHALAYLHERHIVHRDVKDENVIVSEERFHVKLIDFGSAALSRPPGRLFSTFCGTMEYCSPEVLQGNKYAGPELEMWALGVTLYTLVFGENPFYDVDETIQGALDPPFEVSPALLALIGRLLEPSPERRAAITEVERAAWVNQDVALERYSWASVLPDTDFHGNTASDHRDDNDSREEPRACLHDNDPDCDLSLDGDEADFVLSGPPGEPPGLCESPRGPGQYQTYARLQQEYQRLLATEREHAAPR